MNLLIIDTETTGLAQDDEIVEFAGLLLHRSGSRLRQVAAYEGLREPGCTINPRAEAAHGLSMAKLRGRRLDMPRITDLFTRADFVIAHNAGFDRRFVQSLVPESRTCRWLCSCRGIAWKSHGLPNGKLQDLLAHHGIDPGRAHRAMSDVVALAKLLAKRRYLDELMSDALA
jgi:DNA polymerase III subunit epsilon